MTAHLIQSEEVVLSGETLKVACQREIHNAQIVYAWDSAEVREKLDLEKVRGLCTRCKKLYIPIEGRSLLYAVSSGVVEGQESMEAQ